MVIVLLSLNLKSINDLFHCQTFRNYVKLYPPFFVYNVSMEKFTLINSNRSRIKVFEPFEDISTTFQSINAIMISYGFVYKRSSKPVMKGSRVETIEDARKEYKQLLDEGWKKTSMFKSYFLE